MSKETTSVLPFTPETKGWSSALDTSLPIDAADIPGFVSWVNCNGFHLDRETGKGHDGFDFGAYLREDGMIVVGLPQDTPIRAVANGVVRQVLMNESTGMGYGCVVNVEHGGNDSGMFSSYVHVNPTIEPNVTVGKGDVLGSLYKDDGNQEGRLVHLHMGLADGWGSHGTSIMGGGLILRQQDPGLIDRSIYDTTVSRQGFEPFDYAEVPGATGLALAHFAIVKTNGFVWTE
ncbi:hypothetical protein EB118_07575 [bacterium]|nr:hypothetical protein [bacterium]NBX97819.1 hypothetical protein [bacterium]NDC94527.1 hypothetical protein [bacterium]NDD83854.1 hypothetical protein [bacterium]NDG29937.1 hypothetical protein [bacterium]